MTQLPDGGGVVAGGGVVEGVQPASLTVAVGVWRSETTTLQSGALKPDAATLKAPDVSDRAPAALAVDSTVMKMPGAALVPWRTSWPPLSSAFETVRADALAGTMSIAARTTKRTRRIGFS